MDFTRLKEFISVADTGSFTAAATLCGVSCATMNARMHAFEEDLGTRLFEPGKKFRLTGAGIALYENAGQFIQHYETLQKSLLNTPDFSIDHLRIGLIGCGMPMYLGPYLDTINLRFPNAIIDLVNDTVSGIEEGLLYENIDLFFGPVLNSIRFDNICRVNYLAARPCVTLPASHKLAEQPFLTLKELDGETFIQYPRTKESSMRRFIQDNLDRSEIRYQIYDACSEPSHFPYYVPIGKGILLLPDEPPYPVPRCVCVPVKDISCPASLSYFYREDARPEVLKIAADFAHFLKEVPFLDDRPAL